MKILYISALSSKRVISTIYQASGRNPGFAVQKFSRLLVQGLAKNGCSVSVFSVPPTDKKVEHTAWIHIDSEIEDGVLYHYVPFLDIPFIKHIGVLLYTFFYVIRWGLHDTKNKAVICDVLAVSVCMGALFASKIVGVQCVGVVTDIYSMMQGKNRQGIRAFISKMATKMNEWYISAFSKYILLTEAMNDLVNPKHRPMMVMEALCDSYFFLKNIKTVEKHNPPTILYAGGLHEKYGLGMLVEGFLLSGVQARLVLYGDGPYVPALKALCDKHTDVEYRGVASNEEVVEEERKATLLVNPRFSSEEYTKYSFPSKNMEYMVSGTPIMTARLPGMPKDYNPYVYVLEDETTNGMANCLHTLLSDKTKDELSQKGKAAQQFVLEKKNNVFQAKRIIAFVKE